MPLKQEESVALEQEEFLRETKYDVFFPALIDFFNLVSMVTMILYSRECLQSKILDRAACVTGCLAVNWEHWNTGAIS